MTNSAGSISAVGWQHLNRQAGSISAVSWQHLGRDHAATQPWVLAASQPWLTVELPLQYVIHSVLNLPVRFEQFVLCSRLDTTSRTSCAAARRVLVSAGVACLEEKNKTHRGSQ